MYLLSLETSTKIFSLAVSKNDRSLRLRNIRTERILESSIIPAIDKLLGSCGLNLPKIDAFVVGLGPGSFTSLRVGLATVKAFAMATGKKLVGINSLDVIASGVSGGLADGRARTADEICVIVDAKRAKVYAAVYENLGTRKTDYLLTTIDDVLDRMHGTTLFVGDGVGLYKNRIIRTQCRPIFASEKFWYPRAQELAKLAVKRLENNEQDDPAKILPVYLYPSDCQVDRR